MLEIFPIPPALRVWSRRYKLRLQILSCLLFIVLFVWSIDFLFESLLVSNPTFQAGPLKITGRHFRPAEQSLLHPANWDRFLNRVTIGKPGLLGKKWFYVLLIILYIILTVWVFLRLTPPETIPPSAPPK